MLSRSSFKADLAAYRANMKPPQKPGARGPLGIGNLNTADAAPKPRTRFTPLAAPLAATWTRMVFQSPGPTFTPACLP